MEGGEGALLLVVPLAALASCLRRDEVVAESLIDFLVEPQAAAGPGRYSTEAVVVSVSLTVRQAFLPSWSAARVVAWR